MYKSLMYIKERYGNPTVFLSENGNIIYQFLAFSFFWLGDSVVSMSCDIFYDM